MRKFVLPLWCETEENNMNRLKLTQKELDLINAIRNYRASKHNPSNELYFFIVRLLDELLDDE